MRARRVIAIAGAVFAIAIAACTLTLSLGDGPRRRVLGELFVDVMMPTYEDVVMRTDSLRTSARAFESAPTIANLGALRDAWRAARQPWKETDAFRFGPLALVSLGLSIDQVVDPARIEEEIAGAQSIDAAYFATLGANKKGFHAIEYLIFDGANVGDTAVLASLADPRRLAFLVGAADDVAQNARALRDAWEIQGASLADPGADNEMFETIKKSVDDLVNAQWSEAEQVADMRIGTPLGTKAGGTPQPDEQESGPSDTSVDDMAGTLRGIRNIYFGSRDGAPGRGIGSLVAAQSPALDRRVRDAFDRALAAVAAIPTPYREALLAKDPRVLAAYDAVQELEATLRTEVVSSLGATVKFNDNDGD